ncbi:MAG: hypothetical protein R2711_05820, partial [Acidimicrobiales bacterium]
MGTEAVSTVAALVALAGIAGAAAALHRRRGPVGWWHAAVALLALAAASAVAAVAIVLVARERPLFPLGHAAYLIGCGAVPATAVVVLAGVGLRRGRLVIGLGAALLVVLAPVGWYASHVAPYRLRVDRATVELPAARAGRDPVRIGILADLQTTRITSYEQDAVTRLLAERPDVILVPGDLFQGTEEELAGQVAAFRRLLGRLRAPGGVYAVRGDVDTADRMDVLLEGTGIRILDDEIVTVQIGDRTLRIGGNRLLWAP